MRVWHARAQALRERGRFFHRSAGACPPRSLDDARTMARETRSHARVACEGPSPTMKGDYCIETGRSLLPALLTERALGVEDIVVADVKDIRNLQRRRAEVTTPSHDCLQNCILRVFRWDEGFNALSLRYYDARRGAEAFPNRRRIQLLFSRIRAGCYLYVLCVKNLLHFFARGSAVSQIRPIYHYNSSA